MCIRDRLYQLRGRVGRSNRLAYAYLTYRREKIITEDAKKRLQAIKEFTELGSGFKVALRDLEIRGAGNILGAEQHGFMVEIGFDLYSRLLEEAVSKIKKLPPKQEPLPPPHLDLKLNAYLPSSYIINQDQKIDFYQRIYTPVSYTHLDVYKRQGENVFLIQPLCDPINEHIMELLILIDALKRASARSVNAVIPYYAYARQDRKTRARDPITAKLLADLITAAGASRVVAMDLHAGQIQGFFNIPFDHLTAVPIIANYLKQKKIRGEGVVVSPDLGGVTRARELANRLGWPIAVIDKKRPAPNQAEVMNVIGEVKNRVTILIDDIIDTCLLYTSRCV